jgi:FdhD protein
VTVERHGAGGTATGDDWVAREEPLEIRVEGHPVAVAMRTPGHDRELAAGFLLSEGVVAAPGDIFELNQCPTQAGEPVDGAPGAIDVLLTDPSRLDLGRLTRHVFTSSSCGLCGKATIEAVNAKLPPLGPSPPPEAAYLLALPGKLAAAQPAFRLTGGLHACALFGPGGELRAAFEDVGRHNALDKLVGHALLEGWLPLAGHTVLLSGRVSFEMVQKALAAGVPDVAAISAPSSLAVEFARASNQHLVGFLRPPGFNRYC